MKVVKLKKNIPLKKKDLSPMKKACKMEETDEFYIFSEIKNKNLFTYNLSYLMVDYMYLNHLKPILVKEFDNTKVKQILKNHEDKSFEKGHLAFLLKTKLGIYLKNNDILNIPTFLKFNAGMIFTEIENIADLEIDANGDFLTDEIFDDIDTTAGEEYLQIITLAKYLELGGYDIEDVLDLHVFKTDKNEFKIFNEYNKPLKLDIDVSIKTLADQIYGKEVTLDSKEYILTKFGIYLIFLKPERIILYSSLEDEIENFIQYFSYFKVNLKLETECYKSSEKKPS